MLQYMVKPGARRLAHMVLAMGAAVLLTACGGGGGNAGTPVIGPGSGASAPGGGSTTPVAVADLVVVLSKTTLANSGSDSITATVTSVDANRAAIGGVPVSFSVDAGAIVTPSGTTTDSKTGVLTATLTQGSNATVRAVNLTVTSGSIKQTVTFNVVQVSTPSNPQAARLTLALSAFSVDNAGGKEVIATATAIDANQNALPGIPVQLSVTDGLPLTAATASSFVKAAGTQTNTNGQVTGTVNIGKDLSNRTVTVTATSGSLVATAAFQVNGTQFNQSSPIPAVVNAGATGKVFYTLSDKIGNGMPGIPITVSGSGLVSQSGVTDLNGGFVYTYTAPNAPGSSLQINATAGGVSSTVDVTIAGGSTVVPSATLPVSKTLNLSANVVPVNTPISTNQVAIYAIFRDGTNAPVNNVRVLFDAVGDNGTGAIVAGANAVLSDATGTATTSYKPGGVSSPTNGVLIRACWKTSDFTAGETVANCPAANLLSTPLTIVSNPVSISIGTDNTISAGAAGLTYIKKYAVLVVDSAGNPKADVQITPSVDLGGYGKGYWLYNPGTKLWERSPDNGTVGLLTATCANEDVNRNGVIDTGEDLNSNGQLDPRKSDVSITLVGSTKTDANGLSVLQLEYPKSLASWVKFKITVTAAGVLSPPAYYPLGAPVALPSVATPSNISDYLYSYLWLPVSADDLKTESPAPAFAVSPYGSSSSCLNFK